MAGGEGGIWRVPEVLSVRLQVLLSEFLAAETVQVGTAIAAIAGELQLVVPPGPVILAVKVVEAF